MARDSSGYRRGLCGSGALRRGLTRSRRRHHRLRERFTEGARGDLGHALESLALVGAGVPVAQEVHVEIEAFEGGTRGRGTGSRRLHGRSRRQRAGARLWGRDGFKRGSEALSWSGGASRGQFARRRARRARFGSCGVRLHRFEGGAAQALARRDRQELARSDALGADHVTLVSAVFDLATDALPILLERIVARDDRLQLEALGGVSDLLPPQHVNPRSMSLRGIAGSIRSMPMKYCSYSARRRSRRSSSSPAQLRAQRSPLDQLFRGVMVRLSKQAGTSQSLNAKCSCPSRSAGSSL